MAAADFFLKIDGIKGESTDKTNKDEIELLSWSFGAANSGTAGHGGGMGSGKVSVQDFHFTMHINKASPNLFMAVASGKHIKDCLLTCRKPTGDGGQQPYLKVYFDEVLISSYNTGGHEGSGLPVDQISFNFTKIKFEYQEQDAKGNIGKAVTAGWDVKSNAKHG